MARSKGKTGSKRGRAALGALSLGRMMSLAAFLPIASRIPDYARLVGALVLDDRMPPGRKALLAAAAGYLAVGRDVLPDDVPIIGGLDDVIVVVLAVDLFLDGVPDDLLNEKLAGLGMERRAFDRDMAEIRRLTPGPVRRTIRRIPTLVADIGGVVNRIGLGPRLRGWIN